MSDTSEPSIAYRLPASELIVALRTDDHETALPKEGTRPRAVYAAAARRGLLPYADQPIQWPNSSSAARADPRGSAAEVADTAVSTAVSRRRQT